MKHNIETFEGARAFLQSVFVEGKRVTHIPSGPGEVPIEIASAYDVTRYAQLVLLRIEKTAAKKRKR